MSKFKNILILLFYFSFFAFAQIETIEPQNEVYDFLKILSLKRVISGYDDVILPLAKVKILSFLEEASENKDISSLEREIIQKEIARFRFPDDLSGSEFLYNIKSYREDPFYFFVHNDSTLHFQINPILDEKVVYSFNKKAASNLFNFGGIIKGTYLNKIAFEVKAKNGFQSGEKSVSFIDQEVRQSFTFNKTGLNFFDYTEGYLRYEDQKVNLEIGRKRILWGTGIEKIYISSNAPIFDFIKISADFNFFNFNYLHGWLVQPLEYRYDSTESLYRKIKNPKYIALSRFGFRPSEYISFGITQSIIYANRPFEAAYLNPFLFFESAQRSMNDIDNSFLGFDLKVNAIKGLEIVSEINFDDFNFSNIIQNRYVLTINTYLSHPLMPKNLLFAGGAIKIDPFVYSHEGIVEALTYTNNSYYIGPNIQPNSLKFYFYIHYFLNSRIFLKLKYDHIIHGANIYDSSGRILENKGGNMFEPLKRGDTFKTKLLSGIRERENILYFSLNYSVIQGMYFSLNYQLNYSRSAINSLWSGLKFEI